MATAKQYLEMIEDLVDETNKQPGLVAQFWSHVAYYLFSEIHNAALQKSSGGTDSLGNTWKDIDPKTKAYGRLDLRKGLSLPGPKNRPTLSPELDRIWRGIYASKKKQAESPQFLIREFNRLQSQESARLNAISPGNSSEIAAKTAWAILKRKYNAQTLLDLLGNKNASILRQTGRLIESLQPTGDTSPYRAGKDQIYEAETTSATLGSSVPYASAHDEKRPLWPDDIDEWVQKAVNYAFEKIEKEIND